jgi:hypothetical protein
VARTTESTLKTEHIVIGGITTHSTRPASACLSSTLSPILKLSMIVGGRVNSSVRLFLLWELMCLDIV